MCIRDRNNNDRTDRRPDCVTELRMGNSVLTVSGFFKQGATDTAADKMMKPETVRTELPMRISVTQSGRRSVSYTHLDVYKRQKLFCWKSSMAPMGRKGRSYCDKHNNF